MAKKDNINKRIAKGGTFAKAYAKTLAQKPVGGRQGRGTLNAKNNKGTVRHQPKHAGFGKRGGKIGPSQAGTGHAEK